MLRVYKIDEVTQFWIRIEDMTARGQSAEVRQAVFRFMLACFEQDELFSDTCFLKVRFFEIVTQKNKSDFEW